MRYEIPLIAAPQRFGVTLSDTAYIFVLSYKDVPGGGWLLDINRSEVDAETPLVRGMLLVPGVNLMAPYTEIEFPGRLYIEGVDANPPDFDGLGTLYKLIYEV